MSRVTFYEPGKMSASVVASVLGMVGSSVPESVLQTLSPIEMLMVYDWAIREHMRASDNFSCRLRQKPLLLKLIEVIR